jgi:tetratricopeptide (TPR) repeat protein
MTHDDWIILELDARQAQRLGLPVVLPVPAAAREQAAETLPPYHELLAWAREFAQAHPLDPVTRALLPFLKKGPLWEDARRLLQEEDWEDALPLLERIHALDPDDASALFNLGTVCRNLGDPVRSLRYYALCEDAFSDVGLYFANRARSREAMGDRDGAVEDYSRALELIPGDEYLLEKLVQLGALVEIYLDPHDPASRRFLPRADYEAAVAAYWADAPEDPDYFITQGRALLEDDRPLLALQAADRALALDANRAEAWFLRGVALWRLQRDDEARTALEEYVALAPHAAPGYLYLGRVLLELRGREAARPLLERALALDPNLLDAVMMLVQPESDADVPEALEQAEALAAHFPHAWAPWRAAADLAQQAGLEEETLHAFAEALARGADDETLAAYLAALGEADRMTDLLRVVDDLPDLDTRDFPVRWNAALAYLDAGRTSDARRLLEAAYADPDLSDDQRAMVREQLLALRSG